MLKNEFINMCKCDAGDNDNLLAIVDLYKKVIPENHDCDSEKDPKTFYNYMYDYASKNKKNNCFCINPSLAEKLACEFLQINNDNRKSSQIINLEDFF